jgi:crotonobetainyl-CoA:carnitine CoA-transferase CaiB-like acyl-CoA transferase
MSQSTPSPGPDSHAAPLPYAGIRVVEFTHMVMGPSCGMMLADLGAEVIKVEPVGHGRDGDATRKLLGSGSGFFPLFNRNKKSLTLDLQTDEGRQAALHLIATADVVCENFKPGTMHKLGLDYDSLKERFPRLVYVSHKGFLPGPYEHRTALDEVVQMMGGLAYMTGRPAIRCARAPASTTSWAACSVPSACSRPCASASVRGAGRRCKARCSRTASSCPRSTCSNT